MEKDIREFLEGITVEALVNIGVLRGETRELNNRSVDPLLGLMREHSVTRVVARERNWFLASDGKFGNPEVITLESGDESIFNEQNHRINPFYKSANRRGAMS